MKQTKRILKIELERMDDTDPDTSWLGEYSNRRTSEFSIDRAHEEDCPLRTSQGDYTNTHDWSEAEGRCLKCEATDCSEVCPEYECECGEWNHREYRYFNPSFNYVDEKGQPIDGNTPEEIRKYVAQDYARMEGLQRGNWVFIGIGAKAEVVIGGVCQKVTSGGLWGIESDSEESYIREEERNQLSELRRILYEMGFNKRAIAAAVREMS